MNETLIVALKIALANTFSMYAKAHAYHWNVQGPLFVQYHDFFGELYEELHGAIDPLAEEIRMLNAPAPHSITNILAHSTIPCDTTVYTSFQDMLSSLIGANQQVIMSLDTTFKLADEQGLQGLADVIAARLSMHKKHQWMLTTSLSV